MACSGVNFTLSLSSEDFKSSKEALPEKACFQMKCGSYCSLWSSREKSCLVARIPYVLGILSTSAAFAPNCHPEGGQSPRYWPQFHGDMAPPNCEKTKNMGSALNGGCRLCSGIGDSGSRSVSVRHGCYSWALQRSSQGVSDRFLRIVEVVLPQGRLSSTSKCTTAMS